MLVAWILLLTPFVPQSEPSTLTETQTAFFEELQKLCGSRFEGFSVYPDDPTDSFVGKRLVAVFETCTPEEMRITFAVGQDTSRTWVITKSPQGLLLKHDHRYDDGKPHEITMYGGWATDQGSATSQFFASDAETTQLIPEAATNVWNIRFDHTTKSLTYYLERHNKPRFKARLGLVPPQ